MWCQIKINDRLTTRQIRMIVISTTRKSLFFEIQGEKVSLNNFILDKISKAAW